MKGGAYLVCLCNAHYKEKGHSNHCPSWSCAWIFLIRSSQNLASIASVPGCLWWNSGVCQAMKFIIRTPSPRVYPCAAQSITTAWILLAIRLCSHGKSRTRYHWKEQDSVDKRQWFTTRASVEPKSLVATSSVSSPYDTVNGLTISPAQRPSRKRS